MEEGYQLKLKSIKTILKVKGKQALWEEENESKQECLKVCVFYRRRKFQQKKTKQNKKIRSKGLLSVFSFLTPPKFLEQCIFLHIALW